jgi:hypothetical protein
LAVTPATRSPVLPDVPSVGEFLPGYEASVWFGIGAPKATPAELRTQHLAEKPAEPPMSCHVTGRVADYGQYSILDSTGS